VKRSGQQSAGPVDGRVARGLRIREQSKDKIVDAYIELVRAGNTLPTVGEVARQAQSSVRVVFKHFTNINALREVVIRRLEAQAQVFFQAPIDRRLPLLKRLHVFLDRQTAMLEAVGPFRRAALIHETSLTIVRASLGRVRQTAVQELTAVLGDDLFHLPSRQRRELIVTLHMICAWPSWETLRVHHGLTRAAARKILEKTAIAVLKEFFPDLGQRRAPDSFVK
jgi:AcrR family transcriptional regulator